MNKTDFLRVCNSACRKRAVFVRGGIFASFFVLCLLANSASAVTTVPTKMNFQGRLANSAGNILQDGIYNMKFRLYDAASGGTLQWSEDRLVSATQGVSVTNGQFSVQLGSVTSLPASVFTSDSLYFEIELPTPASATTSSPVWTEGAMTPRSQLATSAYAFNSETLDGLDSAAFGQLDQNNVFTGNNTFNGTLQGGSSLTLGTSSAQGSLVLHDGNGQTGTLAMADTSGNYTYTIPVTTANDTFCLATLANCADGGVTAVGSLDGGTANATGASIVGSTIYLQSASTGNAGLVNTTTQSFAGDKTFTGSVTVSGTTALNDNVSVAASKSIQFVGGATGTRPASPAEGMVYYDTTTKQLLTYANGKWQADGKDALIVAASNSSQKDKDAADYVADGNTGAAADGDQVQINQALTAATGKKVVLLAGTYTVDASITVPSNTTITGMGQGTVVTIPNSFSATINIISVSGTDTVVENLLVDQNTANQTSGTIVGISSSGSNNTVQATKHINVRSTGIAMNAGSEAMAGRVHNNIVDCTNGDPGASSSAVGVLVVGSTSDNGMASTAQGNTVSNCGTGIRGQSRVLIMGNTIMAGRTNGIDLQSVRDATVSGNTVSMLYGNFSNNMGNYALLGTTITSSAIANNTFSSGFSMVSLTTFNRSTFTGNTMDDSANLMLYINGGSNNTISNNVGEDFTANQNRFLFSSLTNSVISSNTIAQINLDSASHYDQVLSNQINATGATSSNMLQINGDNTTASDNVFSGVGSGLVALNVTASADSTYLSNNRMVNSSGATFTNDVGTNTIYSNQLNSSGQLINRSSSGLAIQGVAGTNLFSTSDVASVTIGTSDTTGTVLVLDTKTDAGDPTGIAGGMYYNSDAGRFRCYQAGAWKNCEDGGNATTLDGIDSSGFGQIAANNTFTGVNAFDGATFSIGGTANVAKFNVANLFNVDSSASRVSIGASDTTGTVLVLDTKTDAGDPTGVDGAMYYNSSSKSFRCYQNGEWRSCIGGLAYANTSIPAGNTITASGAGGSEALFASNYTIPTGDCRPGKVYRVVARGQYVTQALASPNLTINVKLGSTTVGSTTATGTSASMNNRLWTVDFTITCLTNGASGTVEGMGIHQRFTSVTNAADTEMNTGTTTLDNTGSMTLQLGVLWSNSNAGNSITLRQLVVESLGP